MAKVESLYGTTPAEIFQSGLERNEQIEAVAACVLWKDGTGHRRLVEYRPKAAGLHDRSLGPAISPAASG